MSNFVPALHWSPKSSPNKSHPSLQISSKLISFSVNISPCSKKTCNQFISDQSFKNNLTGKEYEKTTYDKLSCGSLNIIYGIHCIHCGLVCVGETGKSLRSRMNGHRSAIKKGRQNLLHRHFYQPNHSVDGMSVKILEKILPQLWNSFNGHSSKNKTRVILDQETWYCQTILF